MAAVLVQSALSHPRPYTGLVLRGDWVAAVDPGSPGARAGFAPGDRIPEARSVPGGRPSLRGFLADAAPGRPLTLERIRDGERRRIWLVPEPLPDAERRGMAALLAVAAAFVLLGGWVWSERRDPLTRTFFLLCLSFAWLLAPVRQWTSFALELADEVVTAGIQVYLPALFIHFFALFPESRTRGRRRGWVFAAYAIASALFLASLGVVAQAAAGVPAPRGNEIVQGAMAIWFATGLLTALGLFAASYRGAGSRDARRRLRVALIGTALGALPLAALIAVRNLSPGTTVPGERSAVVLTLLVPASFAWATAVHRIFDFRVALRGAMVTLLLAAAGGTMYVIGEWLVATWWPELSGRVSGGALAFVALAASLGGPAAPWLGALGARVLPRSDELSLSERLSGRLGGTERASPASRRVSATAAVEQLMGEVCQAITGFLRLDGCLALIVEGGAARAVGTLSAAAVEEPAPGIGGRLAKLTRSRVRGIDSGALQSADRQVLDAMGVAWLMPIGQPPLQAVMLFGRRLAGAWLSRREILELERFAHHVSIALENEALRREASSHGALERELKEAGAIQAHLLPRRAPVCPTIDCAAAALSSEPVGGDYYDFIEGPGRDFTLAVGDAAGKGVPAALILAQVQPRFRSQARQGLSPGQLLEALNRELVGLDQPEKFVGLLCARVEVRRGRIWFANAGLTPPLVRHADGSFREVLGGGILLGVRAEATYSDACVELGAGDVVVVYTDGLTEARRGEELFGTERVKQVLDRTARRRAADILEALLVAVRDFADRPLDDLTVLVLKQLTGSGRFHSAAPQFALKQQPRAADAEERGDTRPPPPPAPPTRGRPIHTVDHAPAPVVLRAPMARPLVVGGRPWRSR